MSLLKQVFLFGALLSLAACTKSNQPGGAVVAPKHVLFIGNSYTFYNGGLDQQLQGLAPGTQTESVAVGGYTLENHWQDGKALSEIRMGGWDFVVLQEQSQRPVFERTLFANYSRKFDDEIRAQRGKTILLMTWDRPENDAQGVTTNNVAAAYTAVGKQLGIPVVPVGLAFGRSLALKPKLQLYIPDGHPTTEGTYLAACVLFETIYGASPVGNSFSDGSISAETRSYLQQVAADTIVAK
jgi:Domain of unknown function (DUF4886)